MDQHIKTLDDKHGKGNWDLWRSQLGLWCIKILDEATVANSSLDEALSQAAGYNVLPRIPRRPILEGRNLFVTYKHGNRWGLKYDGRDYRLYASTKKEAERAADRIAERSRQAHEFWVATYAAFVETHEEGVDFRYQD